MKAFHTMPKKESDYYRMRIYCPADMRKHCWKMKRNREAETVPDAICQLIKAGFDAKKIHWSEVDKKIQLNFWIDKDLKSRVDEFAAQNGVSIRIAATSLALTGFNAAIAEESHINE